MKITKIRDVKTPTRGTPESAGIDFYIPNDFKAVFIEPHSDILIASGIKILIDPGYAGIFMNKSSRALDGLTVGANVVDSDYRGEVHLHVYNHSDKSIELLPGMKLTQMLIMPIELNEINEISNEEYSKYNTTKRGLGKFGSTGKF